MSSLRFGRRLAPLCRRCDDRCCSRRAGARADMAPVRRLLQQCRARRRGKRRGEGARSWSRRGHSPNQVDDERPHRPADRRDQRQPADRGDPDQGRRQPRTRRTSSATPRCISRPSATRSRWRELLIDVGADLNSDNKNGMTPLMIAASRGNAAIVQALLAKGANVRKTDFTGRDALSWARKPPPGGRAAAAARRRAALSRGDTHARAGGRASTRSAPCWRICPGPDLEAGTAAATRERQLTKPAGALGRLEELAVWLATWQGRHPPRAATTRARSCSPATTASRRAASRPIRPR